MKFFAVQCGAGQHAWVPWAFVAPHARQAEKNHHQSLERLNERGGLDWRELLAVVEDRPFGDCLGNQEACELVMQRLVGWSQSVVREDRDVIASAADKHEAERDAARDECAMLRQALRDAETANGNCHAHIVKAEAERDEARAEIARMVGATPAAVLEADRAYRRRCDEMQAERDAALARVAVLESAVREAIAKLDLANQKARAALEGK